MQHSGFVTPEELDQYINSAARELYDILTSRFEDYYLEPTPTALTVVAPVNPNDVATVDLPATFYKLRGLDAQDGGGQWAPVRPFTFQERNVLQSPVLFPYGIVQYSYRIAKGKLLIIGLTSGTLPIRMWMIPAMTPLVLVTDTFDGINGWEEHIVVNVAAMMLRKEESDVGPLLAAKASLEDRIKNMANNRDAGSPERVTDVAGTGLDYFGPFRRF